MKKLNTNYFQLRTSLLMAMTLILAVVIIQSCASDETGQQDHVDTTLELREEPENPTPEFDWGKDVHKIADKMPLFAECNTDVSEYIEKKECSNHALLTYLYKNLKYPDEAREAGVSGRVYLQFVVTDEGTIGKRRVEKDIGAGCGDAALAVLDKMAAEDVRWTPGIKDGKKVNLLLTLPVTYKL